MTQPAVPPYVQRVLGRLQQVTWAGDGWTARCPCFTHGHHWADHTPSLRVSVGSGGKILVKCRTGCLTANVLAAVDLRFPDLFPPKDQAPAVELAQKESALPVLGEGADDRHRRYTHILGQNRGLGGMAHAEAYLKARGIDIDAALERGYACVQGKDPNGAVKSHHLLVPVRDAAGRVVAIKVRGLTGSTGRWWYFEAGCGAPAHCPLHDEAGLLFGRAVVRLTEGEVKADAATLRTGVLTVGCPGVSNWRGALSVVEELGARMVWVAFDWPDVAAKWPVRREARACVARLQDLGHVVHVEFWQDASKKGIDDLLASGQEPLKMAGSDFLRFTGAATA